jgi:hypothetical protein
MHLCYLPIFLLELLGEIAEQVQVPKYLECAADYGGSHVDQQEVVELGELQGVGCRFI